MRADTLGPRSHLGAIDGPVFSLGGGDVLVDRFALELPLHSLLNVRGNSLLPSAGADRIQCLGTQGDAGDSGLA